MGHKEMHAKIAYRHMSTIEEIPQVLISRVKSIASIQEASALNQLRQTAPS